MCTAVTYKSKDFYFGRTLDLEYSYSEKVIFTPRNFALNFRHLKPATEHFAIIGAAIAPDGFPLYYDAVNEKGLCMAGLNFVGNARYNPVKEGRENVGHFEIIAYILSQCKSVDEAETLLKKINLADTRYNEKFPAAELHWIVADKNRAITAEFVAEGLKIYENTVGVLTNNPTFDMQILNLSNYVNLSPRDPENPYADNYCKGLGAVGLPGDWSSMSRFVRAAFVKSNSPSVEGEEESVSQFFHILGSVEVPRGSCLTKEGKDEITVYTSCCNADKGIYYYTTYKNRAITAVDMRGQDLNSQKLKEFAM